MALFMDSDFSLLRQNQQKDAMDFKALFEEQDNCKGEFSIWINIYVSELYVYVNMHIFCFRKGTHDIMVDMWRCKNRTKKQHM